MRHLRLVQSGTRERRFASLPRSDEAELLDRPGHDPAELAHNLRDIRRVNRFLGGTSLTLRHATRLLAPLPPERPATVLDLGTGAVDIPLALARWAKANGRALAITASDVSDEILALAQRQIAGCPGIALARYDARAVPLPDKRVDVVLCSLTLHHFAPADAVRVLRELDRLARVGFVVNDLRRGRLGVAAAWLAAHVTTTNRLTRHDAPLSVRRAYTPTELHALLDEARVAGAVVTAHPWFRMTAVKAAGCRASLAGADG